MTATPSTQSWPIDVQELKPALRLVLSLAHADKGILMLYDEPAATLYPVLAQGFTDEECLKFGSHSVKNNGPFAKAIVGHKRVRIRNAWQDRDAMHSVARSLGFRHLEIVPFFRNDGTVLGTLNLAFRTGHGSPRSAGKLEAYLADLVAVAVGHAQRRAAAEHAYERGDRSNADKIQLLARLSHELRTPLQSISGYVDLMMVNDKEPPTDSQAHMLSRVKESQRILLHIIDDLITFARLEAGHVSYTLDMIPPIHALRAAEAVLAPLAMERKVALVVTPVAEGLQVRADVDKVTQILVNLTANAIKFTPAGGKVTLSARLDHDTIAFDVADTGPGIAPDKVQAIFEPYVQLTHHPDRYGGSGLGLAISREFARGMGGDLSVSTEPGKGAVFTLRLPSRDARPMPMLSGLGRVGLRSNVS